MRTHSLSHNDASNGYSNAGRERSALPDMLTIGEVARRYRITLRSLRFYEDRKLIRPLRHGTARFYDADTLYRIEQILKGKRLGYTLREIDDRLTNTGEILPPVSGSSDAVREELRLLERRRRELDIAIGEIRSLIEAVPGTNAGQASSLQGA